MSLSATYPETSRQERAETRTVLLIVWSATVASYLFIGLRASEILSTDDAMRLVQIRDFLGGQGWFDMTQYRLSPPDGIVMHWSRLLDVPIALLIRGGEMLMPPGLAERVAVVLWPAALLLAFLAGVARLARELAGDTAARVALIFAALTAPVLQHFRPGAIDHHNAQLVLLIWSLALWAGGPARARSAALAGVMGALSVAIGQEMAPAVAALAGATALRWIARGDAVKQPTIAFALALAAGTLGFAAATVPPARYLVADCDALSIVQVVTAGIGGIGLAALAACSGLGSIPRRLVAAGVLGALLLAVMALGFPSCVDDPYARLDPRLATLWLGNNAEARNLLAVLRDLPNEALAQYGLPVAGLVLGLIRGWREPDERRWPWIAGVAVLGVLSLVTLWELRAVAGANAIALALVPAALVRTFPARNGRAVLFGLGRAALIAVLLLNPLALITTGNAAARVLEAATERRPSSIVANGAGTCTRAADYAPLARLPRGLVLAFIDAGPFVLLETDHSVLAAPYHRDLKGNGEMFDIFLGAPGEAPARMQALGIDYVAFCPGAPERYTYVKTAPDGLVAALARGEIPEFLEPVPLAGTDLLVYRPRR